MPTHNNLQAIRTALESAGVRFLDASGGGAGVRFRSRGGGSGGDGFSPALCRAGRFLLNLSQNDLAEAAGLGRSTIADYERGARTPNPENLTALHAVLEDVGTVFIPAGKDGGPGVRLKE